ncbi:RAMP superfamily CRISPR-associated protein [Acanthopleuribacter pedis]|uniref:CRISPR type III-associated protein domain-containing protein n=1 Tax=Acanthopleuribacter pedis TaxID=442870 RepID=A0A8J7QH67_9BACT|nr:RAMP superfamily CRISPR-associated protein [Acanthopleuribacter pedis]MBO1320321.1 hypothetical protein [Acanthopleuribacter pedis]
MNHYSNHPFLSLARLVVETRVPLSISEGFGDGQVDHLIVRDANGCPAIPGSSFAGVLRGLFRRDHGEVTTAKLFGRRGGDHLIEGASRLHVSWGCLHDSHDRPVVGLLLGEERARLQDEVLREACFTAPVKRSRVHLNEYGSASDQGLFHRVALGAGYRFSIELSLRHDGEADETWRHLLGLLVSPAFRLGGGTRAGYGALRLVRLHQTTFDFRRKKDLLRYAGLSNDLGVIENLEPTALPASDASLIRLQLDPKEGFRFGGGLTPLCQDEAMEARLVPVTERRVLWKEGRGVLGPRELVIPGSAVKGALRHRVAYHDHILRGCFVAVPAFDAAVAACDADPEHQTDKGPEMEDLSDNPAVRELFGAAADSDGDEALGHAGRIFFNDLYLKPETVHYLIHNGIDPFTGGVRRHVLYSEEVVVQPLTLTLAVADAAGLSTTTVTAFRRALNDLVSGRLALGAGAGRGHGVFQGLIEGLDTLCPQAGGAA